MIHLCRDDFYTLSHTPTSHMCRCLFEQESYEYKYGYMFDVVSNVMCVEPIFRTYKFDHVRQRGNILC